jgi:hypothetical protein
MILAKFFEIEKTDKKEIALKKTTYCLISFFGILNAFILLYY